MKIQKIIHSVCRQIRNTINATGHVNNSGAVCMRENVTCVGHVGGEKFNLKRNANINGCKIPTIRRNNNKGFKRITIIHLGGCGFDRFAFCQIQFNIFQRRNAAKRSFESVSVFRYRRLYYNLYDSLNVYYRLSFFCYKNVIRP